MTKKKRPEDLKLRRPSVSGEAKRRAQEIVLDLISQGVTVTRAAEEVGVAPAVVTNWQLDDEAFRERYKAARLAQAHCLADKVIEIAEEPVENMVEVRRNELRIDTYKWYVAKVAPQHYGEKVQHDHTILRGVVILPALDYSETPIPALAPGEVSMLPSGEP